MVKEWIEVVEGLKYDGWEDVLCGCIGAANGKLLASGGQFGDCCEEMDGEGVSLLLVSDWEWENCCEDMDGEGKSLTVVWFEWDVSESVISLRGGKEIFIDLELEIGGCFICKKYGN